MNKTSAFQRMFLVAGLLSMALLCATVIAANEGSMTASSGTSALVAGASTAAVQQEQPIRVAAGDIVPRQSLVLFVASWDGHSMWVSDTVRQEITRIEGFSLVEYDVNENRQIATNYDVETTPTLILLDENGAADKKLVDPSPSQLTRFLESL